MFGLNLNGWFSHVLEWIYALPEPPKRKRTKPIEVLCVRLPCSRTKSMQHALLKLGYNHTWFGSLSGDDKITAADFDAVLGHSVAVTEAVGSVFAAELIAAYPNAKSMISTIAQADSHWPLFLLSCLGCECFWAWHSHIRFTYPGLFRALDANIKTGFVRNYEWVYKEHYSIVRGLILKWCGIEDGWEPLCKFLDKPVPKNEPFPHVNTATGWHGQESKVAMRFLLGALRDSLKLGAYSSHGSH
ncbi:hypothetical protein F5Y08DRAFT_348746 [Xylaria arbuscula]|nr:hypothetical protein F5Y08DRAFT_348746 [Xylaria arbuscula]